YTPKALYDIMRAGNRVTTTQVPPQVFMDKFTEYLEKGMDIVYVACSGKLSGSVNTGSVIANELKAKYPDADIRCIDSLNACIGEGMMAIYAAQLRDQGLSAADIEAKVLDSRKLVNQIVTVDSLDTLKRAGRVKASAAFFGNLMGVRPILISDANGNNAPIKKVKGRANSMAEIVNELKETIDPEEQTVYVVHADCLEDAQKLEQMVKEALPKVNTYITYIGPIIGASIGPGAVGVFAFGKRVTFEG
ncbi:MAG: DegV family protein, partial [Clostridia bacterium]|nr:DegV family protein [Clostridia bacterium]